METQTIEITAEQANKIRQDCNHYIDLNNTLEKLYTNPDFQKVFMKNYLEDEAIRLVQLLGDPSLNMGGKKAEYREDLQERMIGIARFSEYLRYIPLKADQARKTLDDLANANYQD